MWSPAVFAAEALLLLVRKSLPLQIDERGGAIHGGSARSVK